MQVKNNQKNLLKKCIILSENVYTSKDGHKDKRHRNRIEQREAKLYTVANKQLGEPWGIIKSLIKVKRKVKSFDTKLKDHIHTEEIAYYISTSDKFNAKEFSKIIRSHWSIENSNHYVRDVTLGEDASRVRKNPMIMATLRSFALNLLRDNKEVNISQAIYRNSLNLGRVLKYKGVG